MCMTTIGRGSTAKIAGACDDGTVRIYDSVAGALRLSLRPEFPILEMTGIPDGSLLVCTHSGRPFITLWDIQTGGLVQTFILKEEAKHTTVSLKGRYLACETSENAVNFWETMSRTQHPASRDQFEGSAPCWLAPEELIMVADRGSVCIHNIILKGPPVHKFRTPGLFHGAVHSQIFNRLAIISLFSRDGTGTYLTIHDVKAGTSSTLQTGGAQLSSIAFYQTANELVCGRKAPGLETVDISTRRWRRFNFPATVTSISILSNGTVVTNAQGSGIQLLSLGQERESPRQPTPPPLAMHPLDKGRIIAIVPTTDDDITLLETSTMSQVLSIPTREYRSIAAYHAVVLCASLRCGIAVRYFTEWGEGYLDVWEFHSQSQRWIVLTEELPSTGSISPSGTRLVTFHNGSSQSFVRVWDTYDGKLIAWTSIDNPHVPPPIDITFGTEDKSGSEGKSGFEEEFDSEDQFYFHDGTHREPYVIDTVFRTDDPNILSITRCAKEQLNGRVLEKCYHLDDTHEWVVCDSQRICWIPPGYFGPSQVNHCWAGSSLAMVGRDGTLRRLTFLESSL